MNRLSVVLARVALALGLSACGGLAEIQETDMAGAPATAQLRFAAAGAKDLDIDLGGFASGTFSNKAARYAGSTSYGSDGPSGAGAACTNYLDRCVQLDGTGASAAANLCPGVWSWSNTANYPKLYNRYSSSGAGGVSACGGTLVASSCSWTTQPTYLLPGQNNAAALSCTLDDATLNIDVGIGSAAPASYSTPSVCGPGGGGMAVDTLEPEPSNPNASLFAGYTLQAVVDTSTSTPKLVFCGPRPAYNGVQYDITAALGSAPAGVVFTLANSSNPGGVTLGATPVTMLSAQNGAATITSNDNFASHQSVVLYFVIQYVDGSGNPAPIYLVPQQNQGPPYTAYKTDGTDYGSETLYEYFDWYWAYGQDGNSAQPTSQNATAISVQILDAPASSGTQWRYDFSQFIATNAVLDYVVWHKTSAGQNVQVGGGSMTTGSDILYFGSGQNMPVGGGAVELRLIPRTVNFADPTHADLVAALAHGEATTAAHVGRRIVNSSTQSSWVLYQQ